jgi:DNA-binding NtrC family response regulator
MSKANVLVVDDQDSIRHFVGRALEDDGYTVVTAGSVREARAAIELAMPDMARASSSCARSSAASPRSRSCS